MWKKENMFSKMTADVFMIPSEIPVIDYLLFTFLWMTKLNPK